MTEDKKNKMHLIDDSGIHIDNKARKVTLFVTLCRIVTVLLIVLGIIALTVGC